jgi:hypothetical protein
MNALTRRLFLKRAPLAASAIALPAVAEAATPLSDEEAIRHHVEALKVILARLHPDADKPTGVYQVSDHGSAAIFVTAIVRYIKFDGPGQYEVELPDGKRPIYMVERVHSFVDGRDGYRVCHWWKAKQETRWKYHADLNFVRKVYRPL